MRLSWTIACALVAYQCALWASGLQPQHLFAPDFVWAWWISAFYWTLTAVRTAAGWYDD